MGIKQFGYWLEDVKIKPHQELNELNTECWAGRLLKEFNKIELPCSLFTVFSTGGVDFVGGFVLYLFMKRPIFNIVADLTFKLGNLQLEENYGFTDGEQIHELIFKSGKMKFPEGWA